MDKSTSSWYKCCNFFDQAIAQAKFYLSGIFQRRTTPFSGKTYRQKLNPLQQISYFGLLNVLLPFQIITGALMWVKQARYCCYDGRPALPGAVPH